MIGMREPDATNSMQCEVVAFLFIIELLIDCIKCILAPHEVFLIARIGNAEVDFGRHD